MLLSSRKIIFLGVTAFLILGLIFVIWQLTQKQKGVEKTPDRLVIWITDHDTKGFDSIVTGFKEKNPQYKNTEIIFQKKSQTDYQKSLLSVMADGNSPDIFMVEAGRDALLVSKSEPLPESVIPLQDIYKKYSTLILDSLIREEKGEGNTTQSYLLGVPLGYEVLGMYYNKSLISTPPTTWAELSVAMDEMRSKGLIAAGIGLPSRLIQSSTDIISLWLMSSDQISSYQTLSKGTNALDSYLEIGEALQTETKQAPSYSYGNDEESSPPEEKPSVGVSDLISEMNTQKETTTDLFAQGKVALIFGYPSLASEIALAEKRAKSSGKTPDRSPLILAAPTPLDTDARSQRSLARLSYFALSKNTKSPTGALDFLIYLMSEEAQAKYIESFPHMIAAQTSFHSGQESGVISTQYSRVRLGDFMGSAEPTLWDYGIWDTYDRRMNTITESRADQRGDLLEALSREIQCEIDQTVYQTRLDISCTGEK